jgi:hypothetical protein
MTIDEDRIRFPRSYVATVDQLVEDVRRLKSQRLRVTSLDEITPVAGNLSDTTLWIVDPDNGVVRGIWTANPSPDTGDYHMVFFNNAGDITVGIDADDGSLFAAMGNVLLNQEGIYAVQGWVGGWVLGVDSLVDDNGMVGMSSKITVADDIRFFAGDIDPLNAPFRVYESGRVVATDAELTGEITAVTGDIGGWIITSTSIQKLASNVGIVLDSSTPKIQIGNIAGIHTIIDGANQNIRSSNFVAGSLGFQIETNTGDAEFNNVTTRGKIKTTVFEKEAVSSVGGYLVVLNADTLAVDMTSLDSETLTVEGSTVFAVNDYLRMKDGSNDEWLLITVATPPTYTVTRDLQGSYAPNNNPSWKKGQAVVSYGQSGGAGGVEFVAGTVPRVRVFTHTGSPWTSLKRVVNLDQGGITLANGNNSISIRNAADTTTAGRIMVWTDNILWIENFVTGGGVYFDYYDDGTIAAQMQFREAAGIDNVSYFHIGPASSGGIIDLGFDHTIETYPASSPSGHKEATFNKRGEDYDIVVLDDAGAEIFRSDASAHELYSYGIPIATGSGGGSTPPAVKVLMKRSFS